MTGHINRLIMRLHTRTTEAYTKNHPESWTIQRGLGGLEQVAITNIVNPFPEVKDSAVDVSCVNGTASTAEVHGQPFYKNKTVEIEIQTLPKQLQHFSAMRDAFTALHGRMVDFAFETALEVQWYYTGRLMIAKTDEPTGTINLKIDTEPFMKSTKITAFSVPTATDIDRGSNGWTDVYSPNGAVVTRNGSFIAVYGNIGDEVLLSRQAAKNKRFVLAASQCIGGEYAFYSGDTDGDRVLGVPSSSGVLTLHLLLDGSHYEWVTENGVAVYKPTMLLDYVLTELALNADGSIPGADGGDANPRNAAVLPSTARIRPEIYNWGSDASVLLDGTLVHVEPRETYGTKPIYPEAVLPGLRADRSDARTICYISAAGAAASDTPDIEVRYREERLG